MRKSEKNYNTQNAEKKESYTKKRPGTGVFKKKKLKRRIIIY